MDLNLKSRSRVHPRSELEQRVVPGDNKCTQPPKQPADATHARAMCARTCTYILCVLRDRATARTKACVNERKRMRVGWHLAWGSCAQQCAKCCAEHADWHVAGRPVAVRGPAKRTFKWLCGMPQPHPRSSALDASLPNCERIGGTACALAVKVGEGRHWRTQRQKVAAVSTPQPLARVDPPFQGA